MTPKEVRNIIIARYLAEYNGLFPIATDNNRFDPPNIPQKWVRLTVKFVGGNQNSLGKKGNRKFLKTGLMNIQVFTPDNKGTDENDELANDSLDLFDGERLGNLWLYNGRLDSSPGNDDSYFRQDAIIEFEFEAVR